MPGDEMQFGTAYVKVEARLDEYERQMQQLEQAEVRSVQRVREFQQDGGGSAVGAATSAYGTYTAIRRAERLAATVAGVAGAWKAVTASASVAAAAIGRILLPILLVAELGRVVRLIRAIPDTAARAVAALREMDLSDVWRGIQAGTVGIDRFMQQIPLVGHLWNGVAETISQVSESLGFPNFTRDLRELDRQAQAAENRLQAMARAARLVRDTGLLDAGEASRRRGAMAGLSGADAIRAEELFNQQDLVRQARENGRALLTAYMEGVNELRGQRDEGLLDNNQFEAQLKVLTDRRIQLMGDQEQQLATALAESRRAAGARLSVLERNEQMQRARESERMMFDLARARAELELDGADERAEMIRLSYRQLIVQAERDGEAERVAVLSETARLRVQAVRQHERERWEAQMEEADRGAQQLKRSIQDSLNELQRAELEMRGAPGSALRAYDINTDADMASAQIRDQIKELSGTLLEYQDNVRLGTRLYTEEEREAMRANEAKLGMLKRQLELTEALRQKRIDLERHRADGGVGRQITGAEADAYLRSHTQESSNTPQVTREGQRQLGVIAEHAKAIRDALDRGTMGAFLR